MTLFLDFGDDGFDVVSRPFGDASTKAWVCETIEVRSEHAVEGVHEDLDGILQLVL